ncbi:hypothetical protein Cni_G12161 [Canna indica]|uniref:Uncharacterized protein n=1 Tax=Canna indica TaxID=4628 RepID=A0AAQ3Q8S5_9LILI|nr:hypothetical protein Cni_G12161 [Canna indica]
MSLLQLPDPVPSDQNLQIWNNAAFDDGGSASKVSSTPPLQPVPTNIRDLDPAKENRSPASANTLPPDARAAPPKKPTARVAFRDGATDIEEEGIDDEIARIEEEIARLRTRLETLRIKKAERAAAGRLRGRIVPAKFLEPKQSAPRYPCTPVSKKIEQRSFEVAPTSAGFRRRGLSLGPLEIFATPARRPDPKRSVTKNIWPSALKKKTEESPAPSAKVYRRGVSLGPLEIHESFTLNQSGDASETPLGPVQSCQRTGFPKLEGIEEEKKVTKESERNLNPKPQAPATAKKMAPDTKKAAATPANAMLRRRGASLGPAEVAASARSCRPNNFQQNKEKAVKVDKPLRRSSTVDLISQQPSVVKASETKKGATTVPSKKSAKEVQSSESIRPKSLFQESKSVVSSKRPSKTPKVRVVASRYSLAGTRVATDEPGSKRRKWSLPELSREKTNSSSLTGSSGSIPDCEISQGSEMEEQMNLDLQIPDNLDVKTNSSSLAHSSPPSIMKIAEMLPKIKTLRSNTESPRDSGCAKRAADLVNRKSFFAVTEGEELNSPCQTLTFHEDE